MFTHVCVLPQSGLEATDCFVEALLCLIPGRCRSVRAVVVAPSWPSVLAGRLTLDLLEYRSHAVADRSCTTNVPESNSVGRISSPALGSGAAPRRANLRDQLATSVPRIHPRFCPIPAHQVPRAASRAKLAPFPTSSSRPNADLRPSGGPGRSGAKGCD